MNVIICCGGTGGHIYPGIAIADKIKKENPDAKILFIGTKKGMENQLVPAAGYEIKGIDAKGFDRKHLLSNVKTLHDTLLGSQETNEILDDFKPDIAIGTGGYVTGPVLMAANNKKIPCYVHEQNAMPGVANKLISTFARNVFVSFDGTQKYFQHPDRAILTGNPVRAEFASLDPKECREKSGISEDKKLVLIFGGSLGAAVLNEETLGLAEEIKKSDKDNIKIIFVSGNRYYDEVKAKLEALGDPSFVHLMPYAYNMPELMCAADLVVCRAGAIAVSEVCACGKAAVLVPSPNVTGNHQYYNAKALADNGAALLIEEKDLQQGAHKLAEEIIKLTADEETLAAMSRASANMANFKAADTIYENLKY